MNCILKNDWDSKFNVMCFLPELKNTCVLKLEKKNMNNEAATSKKQTHAFCRNGKHVSALTSLDGGQSLCNLQPSEWILPDS